MDWIIWLIVIVVIVAIVWWLLNRNSRSGAGTSGTGTETGTVAGTGTGADASPGTGADASPQAPPGRSTPDGKLSGGSAAASAAAAGTTGLPSAAGFSNLEPEARTTEPEESAARSSPAEWETQWSETPPAEPHAPSHPEFAHGAHPVQGERATPAAAAAPTAQSAPVHHPEYTQTHAPTLPGAESAAAEGLASHAAEPSGHLALDQPYGEGSAAPAADGSGPEGFTVKGNASAMTYHDESSPSYEETVAEVWFVSIAHAEAAGFRPPRRSRL
jgi:hypothetical protein